MIEAVFISDLHLSPKEPAITERFTRFIEWAASNTSHVYILGDFFHVWPGDDTLDAWSQSIAAHLSGLASRGVTLYFMHGNRDFLLGERFATLASMTVLEEPTVVTLDHNKLLLVHGDRYCTNDKGHQRLRYMTRNKFFINLFLRLPANIRIKLVNKVRQRSQSNHKKPAVSMDVVPAAMLKHMQQQGVKILVHGHIHKPGLTEYKLGEDLYQQYVLSDWDDNPTLLCYDKPKGFYFELF